MQEVSSNNGAILFNSQHAIDWACAHLDTAATAVGTRPVSQEAEVGRFPEVHK